MTSLFLPQVIGAAVRQSLLKRVPVARSFVSATLPILEKKAVKVPTMGDSITEGTIVEWTVQVGQKVKDGDIVALVETDKVTVDIKADRDGVITKQYGAVDDTVEVGADLYELDTDADAIVDTSAASPTPSSSAKEAKKESPPPAPAKVQSPTPAPEKKTQQQRAPSIHFLGKEGWSRKLAGTPELPPLPTNFGRPAFTEEEVEALMTGGANLVPNVKKHSSGAIFGY